MAPRGPFHHLAGPRLPVSPPKPVPHCIRCGTEDRRRLHRYGRFDPKPARVRDWFDLCGRCLIEEFGTPNPDPLDVTDAA